MQKQLYTTMKGFYRRDISVNEAFTLVASSFPGHIAIRTENIEITYGRLERITNQLANYLLSHGISGCERIGILLDRSPELIISQLAVLKAGAVYVPIDPDAPVERLAFFIHDAKLWGIIHANSSYASKIPLGIKKLDLVTTAKAIAIASDHSSGRSIKYNDPAYVMYTSGSTGTPKGVEIPHRGILRLVLEQKFFPSGPDQCSLLLGSPGFDATTYEIWSALLNGGCCAIFTDHWIDYRRLGQIIRNLKVTCVVISTGLFNHIIDQDPYVFSTAKHVLIGGEALSVKHTLQAMRALPTVQFANGYGPTECTTFAISWVIGDPVSWGCNSIPLGFPLNNTECIIVDQDLKQVPVGVSGELLLGGDGLALGYINRPDLTAERFIPHPYANDPHIKLYRTGDCCYWLPNGMIAYVGRNDDQIKIRGYRVELGEIETCLRNCPQVDNAAVIIHDFKNGVRGLIGCIVLKPDTIWDEAAIYAEISRWLPESMLPSGLFAVDALPLTQNGKVDRNVLAQSMIKVLASIPQPPTDSMYSDLQVQLIDAWRKTLNDPNLGIDSDFFHHGGNSLLSIELEITLEQMLGRTIPVGTVRRYSTPRAVAIGLQNPLSLSNDSSCKAVCGVPNRTLVVYLPGIQGRGSMPTLLAEALSKHYPYCDHLVYPPQDRGQNLLTIEQISSMLVEQLLQVRATGPYVLVGYSFGGLVAYEVARQLTVSGHSVKHVILWDSIPATALVQRSFSGVLAKITRLASTGDRTLLKKKLYSFACRLHAFTERALGKLTRNAMPAIIPLENTIIAFQNFYPQPYSGKVSVLATTLEDDRVFRQRLSIREAWSSLVPADRLHIFEFPCAHLDIHNEPCINAFVAQTMQILGS